MTDRTLAAVVMAGGLGTRMRSAREALDGADEVLVLSGDTPLLRAEVLELLVAAHRRDDAAATVLSFEPRDVRAYGRIVRDGAGALRAIVEAGDASPEELAIREVNSSIYVFRATALWSAVERL